MLVDICVVDRLNCASYFKIRVPWTTCNHFFRFEINYYCLSVKYNKRFCLKVFIEETEHVPSLTSVFDSANWLEREMWDMFGILVFAHKDMRRLLTDYGFFGHPLRKDFPLTGYVEAVYDIVRKRVKMQQLSLGHEFRAFQFANPWKKIKFLVLIIYF